MYEVNGMTAATNGPVGSSYLRKEDPRLLTGQGCYVDDISRPDLLSMVIVRATQVGRIRSIDLSQVRARPAVVAAFTGADLADSFASPLPMAWPVTEDIKIPAHWPLTRDVARYVGDGLAVIVADDRYEVADALEAVTVEYDPVPALTDAARALDPDAPLVHQDLGTNRCFEFPLVVGDVDGAFANAEVTVRERYVNQRVAPAAIEPRGVVADVVPATGELTLWSSTQIPHLLKVQLSLVLGVPETSIRVITPDVGGAFGSKLNVYAEEALAAAVALKLGRPVKWVETRTENLQATIHGRAQIQDVELAATAEGRVTAIRCRVTAEMGAYLQLLTPGIPVMTGFMVPGVYDVPAYSFTAVGVFTNTTPTDAYRGAGRPEAIYMIERAIDSLARTVGRDPADIRRINFIPADRFPYTTAATLVYDSGDYSTSIDRAMELVGYKELRAEQVWRRDRGDRRQLGIGLSTYVEICGLAPSAALGALRFGAGGWESALVRFQPTGKVSVFTGASAHGQGHATTFSQLVAQETGVPFTDVEVMAGDTATMPFGMGTYGSRSLAVGGTAILEACRKVMAKAKTIAAHLLEAAEEDLIFEGGAFSVRGTPARTIPIQAVAFSAFTAHNMPEGVEPMLEASCVWDPPNFTFPFGTHVCVTEVDTETGKVDIVDYVAVDDCGNQINPLIVDGQIQGGIAQGVAQALFEEVRYSEEGQLLTGTFVDYAVPTAKDLPGFRTAATVTPTNVNPLGVKGVGEAGTIGSTPAIVNAVIDALGPLGVTEIDMPCSPLRVWEALQQARSNGGAA
jgi:aerobic carbon-monoxide dehydrogenase large subunit